MDKEEHLQKDALGQFGRMVNPRVSIALGLEDVFHGGKLVALGEEENVFPRIR